MNGEMLFRPGPLRSGAPGNRNDQYVLFETPIGTCAIAWTNAGTLVTLFQLPEAIEDATRRRISRFGARRCDAPPSKIRGFSAHGGLKTKARLLAIERVTNDLF